jgi:hypothetical protein
VCVERKRGGLVTCREEVYSVVERRFSTPDTAEGVQSAALAAESCSEEV